VGVHFERVLRGLRGFFWLALAGDWFWAFRFGFSYLQNYFFLFYV